MPPWLLLDALHRATRPVTLRARERSALREVDPQIQSLGLGVELDARDLARVAQPERYLERTKILRLHPTAPITDDQKSARRSSGSDAANLQRGGAH